MLVSNIGDGFCGNLLFTMLGPYYTFMSDLGTSFRDSKLLRLAGVCFLSIIPAGAHFSYDVLGFYKQSGKRSICIRELYSFDITRIPYKVLHDIYPLFCIQYYQHNLLYLLL